MKLQATIEIYGGGPGSGCKGPNCGRKPTGHALNRGRMRLLRIHEALREASASRHLVTMDYRADDSNKTKTYLLEPYSYRGDRFFGYDRVAKSIKGFKLLNIIRVRPTQVSYQPRWKVEIE